MKSSLLIILIVVSQLMSAQTFYAEYTGTTRLKPNMNAPLDTNSAQRLSMASTSMPQYVEMNYNMQVYANSDYSFFVLEIKSGRFLGMDMAGEHIKVLIDHKNLVVYDYGLKTYSALVPARITSKAKKGLRPAYIAERGDTAVVYFDKNVPKWITGKIALVGNEYGVSKFKSGGDEFYLISWSADEFDFGPELENARKTCIRQSARPMDLLFPNK